MTKQQHATALRYREYLLCTSATDDDQSEELERLFVLEGPQEAARILDEGPDLSGEQGEN